jgi:hypothetical protein
MPPARVQARFIEPMLLLPSQSLPESRGWLLELKSLLSKTVADLATRVANGGFACPELEF